MTAFWTCEVKTYYLILVVLVLLGILRVLTAVSDSPTFAAFSSPDAPRPHRLYAVLGGTLICLLVILLLQKSRQYWNR